MSNYKSKKEVIPETPRLMGGSFSEKMRAMLERKIAAGRAGINLNSYKDNTGRLPDVIRFYDHHMQDDVFDLACAMNARGIAVDFRAWVHWMTDATLSVTSQHVTVRHRSAFFCEHAAKELKESLERYFSLPVAFKPDARIKAMVDAA